MACWVTLMEGKSVIVSGDLRLTPPVSVQAQAVQRLKVAIMTGELQPGERLRESDLSRRMGISRASIREALSSLEAERLIDVTPNRGSSVVKLGAREVEQIHDVWAMLTSEATARFALRVRAGEISLLKHRLAEFKAAMFSGDPIAHVEAANRFFTIILEGEENVILIEVIASLLSRINFLRSVSIRREQTRLAYINSMTEIVAALQNRDPEAARAATRRHIAAACLAIVEIAA